MFRLVQQLLQAVYLQVAVHNQSEFCHHTKDAWNTGDSNSSLYNSKDLILLCSSKIHGDFTTVVLTVVASWDTTFLETCPLLFVFFMEEVLLIATRQLHLVEGVV